MSERSHGPRRGIWTEAQAERELRSLELFGMRFGLDRMRRMMTVLGSPERRFQAIHVLGTNGKSSTTRMTAAILEAHGLRTAAYVSPHLVHYRERLLIEGREQDEDAFAAAIDRAAWAAARVNRTLAGDDHVTQFELLTAAALWEMARREVEVAVVEAGLGGRYDATSVIEPRVTVLTNVGLEHTRWLGPTVRDIAEEKLAAVRDRTTLVLPAAGAPAGHGDTSGGSGSRGVGSVVGEDLAPEVLEVAERVARERDARIVRPTALGAETRLLAPGAFQRRNFALARAAAVAYLQEAGVGVREQAIAQAAAATRVAGRLQLLPDAPPTVLDGAHNPHAVRALVQALPEVLPAQAPLAIVLGVLEDKDAAQMLAALLGRVSRAWFTAPPSERALSPAALQSLARQLGFERSACEPQPTRALAQARQWAAAHDGAVLVTGSVYLVGDLLGALDTVSPQALERARR